MQSSSFLSKKRSNFSKVYIQSYHGQKSTNWSKKKIINFELQYNTLKVSK